jgi:hypothetical protein
MGLLGPLLVLQGCELDVIAGLPSFSYLLR